MYLELKALSNENLNNPDVCRKMAYKKTSGLFRNDCIFAVFHCSIAYVIFKIFSDYLIAVGGFNPVNAKTELLSLSNTWSTETNYPFGMEY